MAKTKSRTLKRLKKSKKSKAKTAAKIEPKIVPYPHAGKKIADFEKELDRHIAGGGAVDDAEKVKNAREQQQESMSQPPIEADLPKEIIKQVIKLPFDYWANTQNLKKLKLSENEAELIANPSKQLLDYYFPNIEPIYIAWLALLGSVSAIVGSRLSIIADIKKQKSSSGLAEGEVQTKPDQAIRPGPAAPATKFPSMKQILSNKNRQN